MIVNSEDWVIINDEWSKINDIIANKRRNKQT